MASFGNFLGRSVSEAAGFGAGLAVGPALHPVVREVVNRTWALHPDMPLSAGEAAAIVAEAVELAPWGVTEASYNGISEERFRALLGEVLDAPGIGELLEARRRRLITPADFTHGLRKAKLETRWDDALAALVARLLDPAVLAVAVQRGIIPDPGILPVAPPTGTGKVPAFPVFDVDALAEAAGSGIDRERFSVMVGNVGLPMSVQEAASAYFRGIIERTDFERAVSEGNTRNEWRDAILEQSRQIPTAAQFVEKHLRGWTDEAGMLAGTARHGMSPADTETLFLVNGRPLSFHQVFIGERRGGTYDGPTDAIDPAFLKSLRESNIRPEWYNLAWAQRYTYPSAFVLRALVQGGDLTADEGHTILLDLGWPPALARLVADKWAGGTTATANPHVTKAQTQLWTTTHRSFIAGEIHADAATPALTAAGVAAGAIDNVLALWREERALIRRQLTPAQIKKAYAKSAVNEATGAAWTRDEALAALIERGYSALDAGNYLEIP